MYIFSWWFLFGVNTYVFIPMMLFVARNFLKVDKNGYTGECLIFFFAWDFQGLSMGDIEIFKIVNFWLFFKMRFLVIFKIVNFWLFFKMWFLWCKIFYFFWDVIFSDFYLVLMHIYVYSYDAFLWLKNY